MKIRVSDDVFKSLLKGKRDINKEWSQADDQTILEAAKTDNHPWSRLAKVLGRSPCSCLARYETLVSEPPKKRRRDGQVTKLMYEDGNKSCADVNMKILSDGLIVISMEVQRPRAMVGLAEKYLKGNIRIAGQCSRLSETKLLDVLCKAARVALSTCPVNCPVSQMEETVSEVLRKVVRRSCCGRSPEIVVVAKENPLGKSNEGDECQVSPVGTLLQASEVNIDVSSNPPSEQMET